jgi:hypothetical protein
MFSGYVDAVVAFTELERLDNLVDNVMGHGFAKARKLNG